MLMCSDTENKTTHLPVMVKEVLAALRAYSGGLFLDCTLGGAGHTKAILDASPQNRVVAFDRDERAIERAKVRLAAYGDRVSLIHSQFSELEKYIADIKFNGILADLGMSTDQLKERRGFSFNDFTPFDMRMDERQGLTAKTLLNELTDRELFQLLRIGGVGAEAKKIARAVVRERPIETAADFTKIILAASPKGTRASDIVPVVFQAIRIAVNDEFGEIEKLMQIVPSIADKKSRFVAVCFHSLEDKKVTSVMRTWHSGEETPAMLRAITPPVTLGTLLTKRAITPSVEEIGINPSARSARLRVFEFF